MCIHYDQPDGAPPRTERYRGRRTISDGGSWQSACDRRLAEETLSLAADLLP